MTIRANLLQIFGKSAFQDGAQLVFSHRLGLTAEGILVELLARVLSYNSFALQAEDGSILTTETGKPIIGKIQFELIECELYAREIEIGYRINRIFLGVNQRENI